ncbi:hypothetical protein [Pseudomonas sp. PS01301]|uniref:defense against restriction DarA-related protein n=1 Tax=Pseudomonas sp. PS01301 TaxID=2991437 RepID=UPI00249BDBF1|nr:hypothetical protein [Pseudomonas sp. PS01301]
MPDVLFDFDNPADTQRSLKRIAQLMQRAGQPVVSHDFDPKVKRTSGVSYHQALLTLASGQTVTLMVKLTGDVFRVLLNGAVLPIHQQEDTKAIAEIAAAAQRNQAKFQAQQARIKVELPKGIRTAAPKMADALAERISYLDSQIAERGEVRDGLKRELGMTLDSVGAEALSAAAVDTLLYLFRRHNMASEDYAVPSKMGSDELLTAKLIGRDDGAIWLVPAGIDLAETLTAERLDAVVQGQALADDVLQGACLDGADHSAAVATLQNALAVVDNNAPINEAAGNLEQAALERASAESFRQALAVLDDAGVPDEDEAA